jgi:hypothetical protein
MGRCDRPLENFLEHFWEKIMQTFRIGDRIKTIKPRKVTTKDIGKIVEMENGRARVDWELYANDNRATARTWIKLTAIVLVEPAPLDHNGTPIAIDRHDDGTYTAEVAGTPTGDTYPTYQAAVDGAIGYTQSLE